MLLCDSKLLAFVGWKWGCRPFSCPFSQNVTHCQKEICSTCFFKESIAAFFGGVSKHPLSTRSLRLRRATVRSTSSALRLHHAHPFVATEEKHQSHAEKQRVLSRSCGLQDLLQYSDCALSCAMRLCECCKPMNNCRDWAFSKQWVGSGAASLSAADIRKTWRTAKRRFVGHVFLRNPLPPFFWGFPSIHSLQEAGSWELQYVPPCLHYGCIMPIPSLQPEKNASLMQRSRGFCHGVVVSKICYNTVIVLSVVLWGYVSAANQWTIVEIELLANSGLEAGLPAFQLPIFAKRDGLPKGDLLDMFF